MTTRTTRPSHDTVGPADTDRYLTVDEAAAVVGKNPETVRRWIREGRLTARKRGQRSYEISERVLGAFLGEDTDSRPPAGGGIFDPNWGPFTRDPFGP